MDSKELREKFLNFFKKRGHKIVSSSSLLPSDPTVLFTTAGMQQFKVYYLGKSSPYGNRVTSCQKCFRTSDIEQVGDNKHLTFLEMLGNFSLPVSAEAAGEGGGDYFKKEAIEFALELLNSKFQIPNSKLWFTYFGGEEDILEDQESFEILKNLGIPKTKIYKVGKEENFWGPTGQKGPCGPTVEIHYDLVGIPCQKGLPTSLGGGCIPNCECGRFVELWNLVFNEYYQSENGEIASLKQTGVDTGMGLERLAMICQGKSSVYETDLFKPIIKEISKDSSKSYISNPRPYRIIGDHIKGSVFLSSEGILPSNVERGYVLRRIIRRTLRYGKILNLPKFFFIPLAKKVIEIYKDEYPEIKSKETDILTILQNEEEKFERTLDRGLKQFEKIVLKGDISGIDAFHLFDTYGFPLELTQELAREKGLEVDVEGFKKAFKRHREISRVGAEKKFGGVGKKVSYEATKLHTATHLLHAALRKILGIHVKQMGSDITAERLRLDFSHLKKMTPEEIKKVEDLINQKIKEGLEVKKEKMRYEEAIKSGALAFFKEKYPEMVSVYSIGDFSKEICVGPHVKKTSELGLFKIIKEESSGSGVRRIRAILE